MTIQEMTKFLKLCKKMGLKRIKTKDFEADFNDFTPKPKQTASPSQAPSLGEDPSVEKMPTEDDLLYWSSDYDPNSNQQERTSA